MIFFLVFYLSRSSYLFLSCPPLVPALSMQGSRHSSKLLLLQEHLVIQSVALNNSVFVETLLSFFFEITILHVSTTGKKRKKNSGLLLVLGDFFLQDTGYYLVLV